MPQALKPQGGIDGIEAFLKVQAEQDTPFFEFLEKEIDCLGDTATLHTSTSCRMHPRADPISSRSTSCPGGRNDPPNCALYANWTKVLGMDGPVGGPQFCVRFLQMHLSGGLSN